MSSGPGGIEILSQGFGYGIIIGIGVFFALLMFCLTYLQNRFAAFSMQNAEEFSTASRSIKPGLIAAGIVSSWTWSATLLTSSTFAYTYGICGGMWYAANGTLQIVLFGLIAIKIKTLAPGAHTFPEIVLSHSGHAAHLTYWIFGIATNILVGTCLVLGGSQVVSAISGINVYAACWVIAFVVAAYVVAGGLRSTFIADYTHTAILFLTIFVFGFSVYPPSGPLGGLDRFYDLLVEASEKMPIDGNYQGSYLAFKSVNGLIFGWTYWQRAIASQPHTAVKAYLAGGMAWYGIPFGFSVMMGLGCAALSNSPTFPTYPNPLSAAQNGAGLSAPAAAIALLGKGGAGLMLLVLFMAVTSSTSAELIPVSSLLAFDIYKTYCQPQTTSTDLVRISHYGILLYAAVLAGFCCILNAVSINLTWLLTVLGVIVGRGAFPVALVLMWRRMSWADTVVSPWLGLCCGLTAWFVAAKNRSGSISVSNTGDPLNALAGNVTSLMVGLLSALILSFVIPAKYSSTDPVAVARADKIRGITRSPLDNISPEVKPKPEQTVDTNHVFTATPEDTDKIDQNKSIHQGDRDAPDEEKANNPQYSVLSGHLTSHEMEPLDPVSVRKATRLAIGFSLVYILVAVILVPYALFGSSWIFSRAGFKGWCIVSFIWIWVGMVICVIWPIIESRSTISGYNGRCLWPGSSYRYFGSTTIQSIEFLLGKYGYNGYTANIGCVRASTS